MEKWHAAVARSAFSSENIKKLTRSEHFSKLRCGKIVEKWHAAVGRNIFTSQNVKTIAFCNILEVPMSQRCKTEAIDR